MYVSIQSSSSSEYKSYVVNGTTSVMGSILAPKAETSKP